MASAPSAAVRGLRLVRPLAFFDLETTGTAIGIDRIVEIAVIKLMHTGSQEQHVWRINPEMPIPPEATRVHGISDADVIDKPRFGVVANEIKDFIEGCDLAGFNVARFDVPFLVSEFGRVGVPFTTDGLHTVDAMTIFYLKEPRNLAAAYRFYCGKALENAHSALADVAATVEETLDENRSCNLATPEAVLELRRD